LITRVPSERNTSSKLAVYLAFADEELDRSSGFGQIGGEVPRHLGDEGPSRMLGDPEEVHLLVDSLITKST
jgi:hypothetical protein